MRRIVVKQRGFTLVELMVAVAIIAILATLAIYGISKYVANSKTVEARNALGQISKDVTTSFLRESMAGGVLNLRTTAAKANSLCPAGPKVPSDIANIKGRKYQSSPKDWIGGWECLRFGFNDPQYYQYQFDVTGQGDAPGDTFAAIARGDLDGDGTPSLFTFEGALVPDGDDLVLMTGANVSESNPDE